MNNGVRNHQRDKAKTSPLGWSQHVTRISVSLLIRDTTLYRRLGGHSFLENWMFKRLGVGIIMPEKVVLVSVVLKTTHLDVPNRQFAERTSSEKTQKDRSGQCGASMYYFENKKVGREELGITREW